MRKVKIQAGGGLAKGLGRYTAVYERDEDGVWIVRIGELASCHTYGDSLSRARSKIREALALWVDDAEDAELVDDVHLPAPARRAVEDAAKLRREAEAATRRSTEATRAMAARLRQIGLSTRDAAELAGLSQQRIAQLTGGQ